MVHSTYLGQTIITVGGMHNSAMSKWKYWNCHSVITGKQ